MKKVALAIAALLVLTVVAPAFSQPFADVPTDHWAFDAIAELAAKGLIEGYPDGTFKGDRALTRYEMAMVVARLLARIEAIKIPPPPAPVKIPPPEVTRADIQTIQRLINEFRAELAALGVRVTAVEEELTALKARVDNTFITGDWTYVYGLGYETVPGSGPRFEGSPYPSVQRNRIRLTFRGRVGSHTSVFLRARWNSRVSGFSGADAFTVDFDRLYFDYAAPFGVSFRVGRDYWTLGDNGVLLGGLASKEGVRAIATFGPLTFTGIAYFGPPLSWEFGNVAIPTWSTYGARAQASLIPGWTFGVNFRADRCLGAGGEIPGCIPGGLFQGWNWPLGVFTGTGWSFDWSGDIIPGVTFSGEYAVFTPTLGCPSVAILGITTNTGCSALFVNLGLDLGRLTGFTTFRPSVNVWYKNYGAYYNTQQNFQGSLSGFWWGFNLRNVRAWGADISIVPITNLTLYFGYENGWVNMAQGTYNFPAVLAGDNYVIWFARGTYNLGHNSSVMLEYYNYRNVTTAMQIESLLAVRLFTRW